MNDTGETTSQTSGRPGLAPTLAALLVGAGLAALTVFILTKLIGAQRSVFDRDEVSAFSLFVKNILNADVSCGNVLRGQIFKPGGEVDLKLPIGYGGVDGPVVGDGETGPGFTLPGGVVHVKTLRLRDKGVKPMKLSVPIPNAEGVLEMVDVDRYLAQVKLEMSQQGGDSYRDRLIEVPVLVNERAEVVACNNQINLADACLALGFRLDVSTEPPACVPNQSCFVGGTFTVSVRNGSTTGCVTPNPITRTCACPEGFADSGLGSTGLRGGCGKFGCVYDNNEVHQCYRCP